MNPTRRKKRSPILKKQDKKKIDMVLMTAAERRRLLRATALSLMDAGVSAHTIAEAGLMSVRTLSTLKRRYREAGSLEEALADRPRPGRPATITKRQHQYIAATACAHPPRGHARWTLTLLRDRLMETGVVGRIGKETIRLILEAHEIKPWRQKMWCVPTLTPEFIERMEDVLALYEKPWNPTEPVVCLDEKTVQLLTSKYPEQRSSGRIRQDYEYVRCGTANVFCAIEPLAGKHMARTTRQKTRMDFAHTLHAIAMRYRKAEKIHLVIDNLNTHKERSLVETFGPIRGARLWNRFQVHYTPKHASWLNQAEIEIGMFSRECLGKSRVATLQQLQKRATHWETSINKRRVTIDWTFSRKKARAKFKYRKGKN